MFFNYSFINAFKSLKYYKFKIVSAVIIIRYFPPKIGI